MANNDEESKTKAVVFLGSGFSAALGLPTTAQLSEKLLGSSNTLRADPLEEFISGIICEFWKKVFGWSTGGRSPTLEDHFTQIDMAAYPNLDCTISITVTSFLQSVNGVPLSSFVFNELYLATFQSFWSSPGPPPGPGALVPIQHRLLDAKLRAQTAVSLANLNQNCKNALSADGVDLGQVASVASQTEYYNTNSFEGTELVSSIAGGTINDTLIQYLGGARAGVLPGIYGWATNNVVVGSLFFNQIGYGATILDSQNITLVHEALHTGTGLNDPQLALKLGLGSFDTSGAGISAASQSISSYL